MTGYAPVLPPLDDVLTAFPPDAVEQTIPDVAAARDILRESRPDLFAILADVRGSFLSHFGEDRGKMLERTERALALSFVRMASRHGSWGSDHHHYHNEAHALELLNGRLARVRIRFGWQALDADAWLQLALFSTCHDLRQREKTDYDAQVGANEQASIAETVRILLAAGFDRDTEHEYFHNLAYMIAGSTFDARPAPFNTAESVSSGGSLAPRLSRMMLSHDSGEATKRLTNLMLIAADLDTANVGEPYPALAGSGTRLVLEREMRSGRSVEENESVRPVFDFLTNGQERYFFDLHRFVSDLGRDVFEGGKLRNAPKVQEQTRRLHEAFGERLDDPGLCGRHIINAFLSTAMDLD